MMHREYALYKGDTFLDIGTAGYLSKKWNIRVKTIYWLAACRRLKELNHKSGWVVVALEEDEDVC